jgi:predicted ATPase
MRTFVGREAELATLRQALDAALAGNGSAVLLSAEAGAGKSTLVEQFLTEVGQGPTGALVLEAGCSEQYGAGEPYQPFVETFRALLTRDQEQEKKSFRDLAKELAPYWLSAIPVAGDIIAASVVTAGELKKTFSGATFGANAPSQDALFFQYTELFFAAAAERPVVLFIDDLHWADRATVALLVHITRRIPEHPVLILGSYRPVDVDVSGHPMRDARQELERYRVAKELVLEPLGTESLAGLIEARVGAPPDPELLQWLARRAGSNALFFEELVGWLQSQNIVEVRGDAAVLTQRPEEITIPRSAEATIEKRLERLDEETFRILQYASIEGNEFDSVTLSRLLDMDELELEEKLEPIERVHRLVRNTDTRDLPNGDLASVYDFSHSLVKDVLHNTILGKRRILLHRKVAEIIEDLHGDHAEGVAHRLAVHAEEGRLRDKAFQFAMMAAQRASRLYAHWDAIDQIKRALRNAEDDEQAGLAYRRLGREQYVLGRFGEAMEAFDEALSRASAGDPIFRLASKRERLEASRDHGAQPLDEILSDLEKLRDEARDEGALQELCEILWMMIYHPATLETLDVKLAQEALQIARETGEPRLIAKGQLMLGNCLTFAERTGEALEPVREALRMYRDLGDRSQEGGCLNQLGLIHILRGEYDRAIDRFEGAVTVFDDIVHPSRAIAARNMLALTRHRRGELDEAIDLLLHTLQLSGRLDAPLVALTTLQILAETYETLGRMEDAAARWEELRSSAAEVGMPTAEIVGLCGLGTVAINRGDIDAALEAERAARALMGDGQDWDERREAFDLLAARIAAATGEPTGAGGILEAAEGELEDRDPFMWATYRFERALILREVDPSTSAQLADDARSKFEAFGAKAMLRKIDEAFGPAEPESVDVPT